MKNFSARARVYVDFPDKTPKVEPQTDIFLTRGSTCSFIFDLKTKGYDYEDIRELWFIFRQGETFKTYKYIRDAEQPDSRISHQFVVETGIDQVVLRLTADDTQLFEVTGLTKVQYEIMVLLDTDSITSTLGDTTIIEKQPNVTVIDSLYGKLLEEINVEEDN